MSSLAHRLHLQRLPRRDGAALIITLAMVVLITIAILAFFSLTTVTRQVEFSRSSRVKADLLADSGGAYAISQILGQITNPSRSTVTTTSGVSIFEPSASTNAWIERAFPTGIGVIKLTDPTFYNLIRQSVPAADTNASTDNTGLAAYDGQTISTARWNEPCLLTGSGFTTTTQIPNWIYFDGFSGATNTSSANAIGRVAYNIYNVGGLLNANVVGYPSGVASLTNLMVYLKGGQYGADLTQLTNVPVSNVTNTIAQTNVDTLATFRFPDSPSATNYVGRMLGASTNGFLAMQNNDQFSGTSFQQNMFESRQDLIRYMTTQNSFMTNALPYLTHFSRSINAPSFKPSTVNTINYDLLNVRYTSAATINHYDDTGAVTTYNVNAGDPLLQRRFSLAKLAWLTPTGPASGITAAAIQACFGLSWNSTQERWDYVGPTGSTIQSSIESLGTIVTEAREPNFFETIKTGIRSGTLGGEAIGGCDYYNNGTTMCTNGVSLLPYTANLLDANKDLHVIQIGANIIDNADTDNYPTRIAMQFGGTTIEKAGVEDLPYFSSVDMPVFMQATAAIGGTGGTNNVWNCPTLAFVWVPELVEPHKPSTSSSGPASIQINFLPGSILYQAGFAQNTAFSASISTPVLNRDLSTLSPITVSSNNFSTFRLGPQPVRDSTQANSLGQMIPSFFTTNSDILGFKMVDYSKSTDFTAGLPVTITQKPDLAFLQAQNVIMRLQYLTPNGQLKTYSTMGGNEALPLSTGIWGMSIDDFGTSTHPIPILKQTGALNNNGYLTTTLGQTTTLNYINACRLVQYDPRGTRFGPGNGHYYHYVGTPPYFAFVGPAGQEDVSANCFSNSYLIYGSSDVAGNLPQHTAFEDGDGVARMPDAGFGDWTTTNYGYGSLSTNAANPYTNLTNTTGYPARPVVLQRPYQSVAELGNAYRDVPWETLNFFNNTSGDSALLDMFSVTDEPAVTAGRVFLGTQQLPVLAALLSGQAQNSDGSLPFSSATANSIALAIAKYHYSILTGKPTNFPTNSADLINFMASPAMAPAVPTGTNTVGVSLIKNQREAIVRALGSTTQMRTWNIMVDLIAQSGRFPRQSYTAGDFVVEGESHVWISVAIDRYTGKIVDEQIEKVNE